MMERVVNCILKYFLIFIILLAAVLCIFLYYKYSINIFDAFFGALFGALLAYQLDRLQEGYKQSRKNYLSLLTTEYKFNLMENNLKEVFEEIQKEISTVPQDVKHLPNKEDLEWQWVKRHITLKIASLNFDPVDFLIGYKNGRKALDDLRVADLMYQQAILVLEERNLLYSFYLERSQIINTYVMNVEVVKNLIGNKCFYEIILYTKLIFEKLDRALEDIAKAKATIGNILKDGFKQFEGLK